MSHLRTDYRGKGRTKHSQLKTPAHRWPTHLPQLVQRLADDYQAENDRISHELYENIAQSLVVIKTQVALLKRKNQPAESPEFSGNLQQLDAILQAALSQIRALADGLYAVPLAQRGLETNLGALCQNFGTGPNLEVRFEGLPNGPLPPWVGPSHTLCLYYFVDQALGYVCAPGRQVRVSLACYHEAISATVRFAPSAPTAQPDREPLPPLLEEWLEVWGGWMEYTVLPDHEMSLTAWMGAHHAPK